MVAKLTNFDLAKAKETLVESKLSFKTISISKNAKIDVLIKKQKNKQTNVRTNRYQNIAEKKYIVATRHHSDD